MQCSQLDIQKKIYESVNIFIFIAGVDFVMPTSGLLCDYIIPNF